jgi:lycopene cyclase domain-containing protein
MYTLWAAVSVVVVVAAELFWLRTGLFRRGAYWGTIAISFAFQIPVDGWLTKLSAPIVIYNPHEFLGVRFPWSIPVEDFAYGFALVTSALLVWERYGGTVKR